MNAKSTDNLGRFGLRFEPALLGSAVVGWGFEPGNPVGEGCAAGLTESVNPAAMQQ